METEEYYRERSLKHNLVRHTKWSGMVLLMVIVSVIGITFLSAGCATPPPSHAVAATPVSRTVKARITYYTGHHERVAMGGRAVQGRSVAAHPDRPFKTQVKIPELYKYLGDDQFRVEDRGPAVTARKASHGKAEVFDVFVSTKKQMRYLEKNAPEIMQVTIL